MLVLKMILTKKYISGSRRILSSSIGILIITVDWRDKNVIFFNTVV